MDNWKSIYIYFIYGTGNARISSEWIADEARIKGLKAVVQQIDRLENIVMPQTVDKPLIGFAFPTHGFNAAPIMLRFIANYNCNNCGICIKECPTSSIRFVGDRPYWKLTCESCMRCLNNCPQRAIEAAHGMAVVFWIIFTSVN